VLSILLWPGPLIWASSSVLLGDSLMQSLGNGDVMDNCEISRDLRASFDRIDE